MTRTRFTRSAHAPLQAIVLSYDEVGHRSLETLLECGDQVEAVFTHEDDPNENRWFGSVAELARERESVERALNGLSDEQAEVICVHDYFEGLLHRSLFEQLLAGCRARGLKTTTLREAARSIATDAAPLPACRVDRGELGGFAASVSWQEPSVNTRYDERASAVRHRA